MFQIFKHKVWFNAEIINKNVCRIISLSTTSFKPLEHFKSQRNKIDITVHIK